MSHQVSCSEDFKRLALLLVILCCISANVMAIGIIVPRQPDTAAPRLGSVDVSAQINNHIAQTRITQVFRNPNSRPVEADFFFPVPAGADITDFVLYMDGKPVKGEVLDKDEAHNIYRDIVRKLKDPGLIEWSDKNLFRVRIFPIPANGEQKMEIEVSQPLTADQGYFRYFLPLTESAKNRRDSSRDIDIAVTIKAESAIRNLYSPTHKVDIKTPDSRTKKVSATAQVADSRDFILYYGVSDADITASLLTYRDNDKSGYFSLRISPPWDDQTTAVKSQPGEYVFVIDTSGSMAEGDKIGQARKALRYCISLLNENDKFNLVRFSSTVEPFESELQAATKQQREAALGWIDNLQARGGTNISEALKTALGMRGEADDTTGSTSSIYTVVFLTDGLPTVGETSTDGIIKAVHAEAEDNIRVFTFGVGNDVNTRLLDTIAEETRAASDYVAPDADLEVPISRFFDKINRPALVGVKLEIPGAGVSEIFPPQLPDLFFGTELAVFGKYDTATTSSVKLSGMIGGEKKEFKFERSFPEKSTDSPFIEKLWATRKVAWLLDQVRKSGESDELRKEIEELAKKYSIVTPYTSYLAMEDEAAPATRQRHVSSAAPVPSRMGWSFGESSRETAAASDMAGVPASARPALALQKESGAMAVRTARNLQSMKSADIVGHTSPQETQDADGNARMEVAGKTFILSPDGVWTDQAITGDETETIKVQYMSEAWFQISDWFPDFREILSLGEKVSIQLNKNTTLTIGSAGTDFIDVTLKEKLFEAMEKRN